MRPTPLHHRPARVRRGSALVLVLLMTITLAALALSAIVLTGSGSMLTRYYDREREFRYAAEAALAMGKSQLTKDTAVHLPDSGYVTLVSGGHDHRRRRAAVAEGPGECVRREERQRHRAVRAVRQPDRRGLRRIGHTLRAAPRAAGGELRPLRDVHQHLGPGGLCYTTGEFIRGRAHSNQGWNSCGTPTYYDTVSAVTTLAAARPCTRRAT